MTPQELHAMARSAADFARMARVSQHMLLAKGKTWLAASGAQVAGDVADGYSTAALQLDQVACGLLREARP